MQIGLKRLQPPELFPYLKALKIQQEVAQLIKNQQKSHSQVIFYVEHPPTFTAGRRIKNTLTTEGARLNTLNAEYYEVDRGGQTTFHGPGQLVCYPVLNLKSHSLTVRAYVELLQNVLINTCSHFGITSHRGKCSETGVWVEDRKIAAIGVQVSRYITTHGFALNCSTDLSWFEHIVPCGITDKGVTSIKTEFKLMGRDGDISIKDVIPIATESFREALNCEILPLEQIDEELNQHINKLMLSL
ncbi:hypothetical protein HK098_007089 [Nowakowskiella sp. JEL0407]|nr:hypothetical protein HK098_007089 [Nowakowskiella sp. JEL0407]